MPSGGDALKASVLVFVVLGPPLAWSVHFGIVFARVMVLCREGRSDADPWLAVSAIPFLGVCVFAGVVAWRMRRRVSKSGGSKESHARPVGPDALLLSVGALAAVVFSLVISLESLAPLYVPMCSASPR
jgi:hypothetical protein